MAWSVLADKKRVVTVCTLVAVEAVISRTAISGVACIKNCINIAHDCSPETSWGCLRYCLKLVSLQLPR